MPKANAKVVTISEGAGNPGWLKGSKAPSAPWGGCRATAWVSWSPTPHGHQSPHCTETSERGTLNESGLSEAQRVPAFRNNQGPDHLRMPELCLQQSSAADTRKNAGCSQTNLEWLLCSLDFSPVRGVTSFLAWLEAVSGVHLGCGLGIAMKLGTQICSDQQLHFSEVA